jgi:hypothetical protein
MGNEYPNAVLAKALWLITVYDIRYGLLPMLSQQLSDFLDF